MSLILRKLNFAADWRAVGRRCVVDPLCCDPSFEWPTQGPGRICQSVPVPIPGNLNMTISGSSAPCNTLCNIGFTAPSAGAAFFTPWYVADGYSESFIDKLPLWPNGSYPLRYAGRSTYPNNTNLHLWILAASTMVDGGQEQIFNPSANPQWPYTDQEQAPWWYPNGGTLGNPFPSLPTNIFGVRPTLAAGGGIQWRPIGEPTFPPIGFSNGDVIDPILLEKTSCPFQFPQGVDLVRGSFGGSYFDNPNFSPSFLSGLVGQPYPANTLGGYRYGIGAPVSGGGVYRKYPYEVTYEVYRQMVFGIDTSAGSCGLLMGFYGFIFKVETESGSAWQQQNGGAAAIGSIVKARSLMHAEIFNLYQRLGSNCVPGYSAGAEIEVTGNGIYVGPGIPPQPGTPYVEITE